MLRHVLVSNASKLESAQCSELSHLSQRAMSRVLHSVKCSARAIGTASGRSYDVNPIVQPAGLRAYTHTAVRACSTGTVPSSGNYCARRLSASYTAYLDSQLLTNAAVGLTRVIAEYTHPRAV